MLSPVGSHPPSVYWRRRILAIGSVVLVLLLIILTVRAISGGDGGTPQAGGPGTSSGPNASSPQPTRSATKSGSTSSAASSSRASSSRPARSTGSALPKRCTSADLAVAAVVAAKTYKIKDEPVVELQVTNTGSGPCVQDLADGQIELKVYNGESRVWGSHDCEIQRGTADRTLAAGQPVRVSIQWSGLTSQPKCAGTRQRVGAGTYTLYATLSGKTGKAAQFSIG